MIGLREFIDFRAIKCSGIDSQALFLTKNNNRLSVWDANDMLEKYCDLAGIKRVTFHKLRASSACALAKAGVPVKAIAQQLGHSGIGVTMRYLDVFNEDREKTKGVLDNLF